MANVIQIFGPRHFVGASANGARQKLVDGTNLPVESLDFAAGTTETAYVDFTAENYASGNLNVRVFWYADTGSSGDINLGASIAAITANTDTQDIETKAFATENTQVDTHLGTTAQREHFIDIAVSNLDSLAAGDHVWLKLRRIAGGSDTMAGKLLVTKVVVSYLST